MTSCCVSFSSSAMRRRSNLAPARIFAVVPGGICPNRSNPSQTAISTSSHRCVLFCGLHNCRISVVVYRSIIIISTTRCARGRRGPQRKSNNEYSYEPPRRQERQEQQKRFRQNYRNEQNSS